jgi:hypothetical protein
MTAALDSPLKGSYRFHPTPAATAPQCGLIQPAICGVRHTSEAKIVFIDGKGRIERHRYSAVGWRPRQIDPRSPERRTGCGRAAANARDLEPRAVQSRSEGAVGVGPGIGPVVERQDDPVVEQRGAAVELAELGPGRFGIVGGVGRDV